MSYRDKRENKREKHDYNNQDYDVVCSDCGKPCSVPFKPDGRRPVYCRECFAKRRKISEIKPLKY